MSLGHHPVNLIRAVLGIRAEIEGNDESPTFKQTTVMPNLRCLSIAAILCCLGPRGFGQDAGWKALKFDIATFQYPASWQMEKATNGSQTMIRLTPDSMRDLSMKMVEIMDALFLERMISIGLKSISMR